MLFVSRGQEGLLYDIEMMDRQRRLVLGGCNLGKGKGEGERGEKEKRKKKRKSCAAQRWGSGTA